jgi:putative transposase
MKEIDKKYLESPFYGIRRMSHTTINPKKNLSKTNLAEYKYPYLLKDLEINRSNQVWASDITYTPMFRGFMYIYAIIDVYSRKIVSWDISITMSKIPMTIGRCK